MSREKMIETIVFTSFGLWWIVAPNTVKPVYEWIVKRKVKPAKLSDIRILGFLWIVVVLYFIWFYFP